MTFLAGGALAGLVLVVPLVILHLRQRANQEREVASLLLFRDVEATASGRARRFAPPPLPLLLALQALALILLVITVAGPVLTGARIRPSTVVVVDDSFWMTAQGALADARQAVDGAVAKLPGSAPAAVVLAGAQPTVIYQGRISGVPAVLRGVTATASPANLTGGLEAATGLLRTGEDRVLLIRAAGDPEPAVSAGSGELRTLVAGPTTPDQGIFDPLARCGIGDSATCEVIATVANTGPSAVEDQVTVTTPGHADLTLATRVPAKASTQVHFLAAPGEQVRLALSGHDPVSVDDTAAVIVPGDDNIPRDAAVTVVGQPAQARSLAQAFAAVPGVTLRLETPADYRAAVARQSDLVVLDGSLSGGRLPPSPAVMLVDPSQLPGGHVGPAQSDSTLSGSDPSSPLLAGADLSSLSLQRGAARQLTLARWQVPLLWSPSGALLAAGDDGQQRVLISAFQPARSTLPELASFPVLAANIVRWALGWAPQSVLAGSPISLDALPGAQVLSLRQNGRTLARARLDGGAATLQASAPGVYTVSESGPGISHEAQIAVDLTATSAAGSGPVDIRVAGLRAGSSSGTGLAAWLLVAALIILGLEWVYGAIARERVARR